MGFPLVLLSSLYAPVFFMPIMILTGFNRKELRW